MDPEQGYSEARKLLQDEYGDSYKISIAYVNKVLNWTVIKYNDQVGLKRFSLFLKKIKNAMSAISDMSVLNHPTNMQTVVKKLPQFLQTKWRDRATKLKKSHQKVTQFEDLVTFVDECAESANHPVYNKEVLSGKRPEIKDKKKPSDSGSSFATRVETSEIPATLTIPKETRNPETKASERCPCCNKDHPLDDCTEFMKKSMENRKSLLMGKILCFSCYGSNHIAKGCTQKKTCKTCNKKHPTTLHIPDFKFIDNKNSSAAKNDRDNKEKEIKNGCISQCESVIYHAILPVRVKQKDGEKSVVTYAFYDNGSGGSFMTENLQQQLGIEGVKTALQLGTMHGQSYIKSDVLTDLIVTDLNDENPVEIEKLYTRKFIPVEHNQIPTPEIVSNWIHLEKIGKEIPKYIPDLEIGLLIGNNCIPAHEPLKVISSNGNGPFAVLLPHGWTVGGPLRSEPSQSDTHKVSVNRVVVREIQNVKEIITPKLLLDALAIDFNEYSAVSTDSDGKGYSYEDKLFLKKVENGVRYNEGHYEIPLPFRTENIEMPNNKMQAIKRAEWQKKKMLKNEKYREDYKTFMEDVIAKGYAERIPAESPLPENGKVWYIPHHGVYHPKKPEKIRVVFDCSSRFQGTSINDQLLSGPNLTNTLVGVLTRFRQEPIGFMGDIEAMFYQVRVPTTQRDFLRFLWWPNADLESNIEEYRMTVHLFGAVSSPSCSNFALKKTAYDNEEEFGPLVARTIKRNFYVDDCLKSAKTVRTAIKLIDDLRDSCAKGGFRLTKFTSNSRAVLQSIPVEDRSKELKNLDLHYGKLPLERALGVYWCIESDTFEFRVTLNSKPLTRRGILSTVSSVYDPLGFVAPFILPAKKLLQELCQNRRLSWDDEIPYECHVQSSKWLNELQALAHLKINRSLTPRDFGEIVSRQFHLFSDASLYGYGSIAYLRLKDRKGRIHCAFLMAKSRLTPVKFVTIPRLELVAAALSARLGRLLNDEVEDKPSTIVYHTDSTTVLRYIMNDYTRFHVFVANRIQLIRDLTDPIQWRYVQSTDNPADYASRGMDGKTLLKQSKWIHGPDFLWEEEEKWPEQPLSLGEASANDPEVKKIISSSVSIIDNSYSSINKLFEFYSNWLRLKRAVAIMLRVRRLLIERKLRKNIPSKSPHGITRKKLRCTATTRSEPLLQVQPITLQELEVAEDAIIRCVQAQSYGEEIRAINDIMTTSKNESRMQVKRKKTEIKRTSSIYQLNPFLYQGILRVGGRLSKAEVPEAMKHPYVLPRKSHVTMLIIRHIHQSLGHVGRAHVLAALRKKYWVVSANSAVRHLLFKCVTCRRIRATPNEQKMADLPAERVNPAPPFTYVGVDYFGPFQIKERRKVLKRYGALFTCLLSRAIHIEVSNSLDTDSFIHALRRFVAQRGPVRQIRCDNGTNFIGAKSELVKAFEEMDQARIQNTMVQMEIEWIFNPPASRAYGWCMGKADS
ncbi:uncharacterized protein LOC114519713 [Dendronephthya gigantea]|uniref:uncharacterized protein LOC114519713 n=1 Tax=Dendronephthya gigantea TaxID=151771 RepID=UPI001069A486|nr:uncharacterized protein LOC114519713 [Dendronephthya gigantea]